MALLPFAVACCADPSGNTYHGLLTCAAVPGSPPGMAAPITVRLAGTAVRYTHPLRHTDGENMALAEVGGGTRQGTRILLRGGATSPGLHETAAYQGVSQGGTLLLTGEQTWVKYAEGIAFRWPCKAILQNDRR